MNKAKAQIDEIVRDMLGNSNIDDIKRELHINKEIVLEFNCHRYEEDLILYDENGSALDTGIKAGEPIYMEIYLIKNGIDEDSYTSCVGDVIEDIVRGTYDLVRIWR